MTKTYKKVSETALRETETKQETRSIEFSYSQILDRITSLEVEILLWKSRKSEADKLNIKKEVISVE